MNVYDTKFLKNTKSLCYDIAEFQCYSGLQTETVTGKVQVLKLLDKES